MSSSSAPETRFWMGNIACSEGAIAAGCRFFAGYPITPASEVAHHMARRMPQVGGNYIQMEDEIGSIAAILGAANAGAKSMTSTSGPGLSLMQENIGLGFMTETPCVIVDVQRGGPSTGMPTLTSQGDMMQARWGSHGDYEMIAYVPASVQEMFDFTVRAFNAAARYRTPVIVLADQVIGHMSGRVRVPPPDQIEIVQTPRPRERPSERFLPFAGNGSAPAMALAGEGYRIHATGLTHDERGYPVITAQAQRRLLDRLIAKIRDHTDEIAELEARDIDDARLLVVCYGSTSRAAWEGVRLARAEGIPVGWLRMRTAWPFPERRIAECAREMDAILVPEVNYGQMVHPVREVVPCPVTVLTHAGGSMLRPADVLGALRRLAAGERPARLDALPPETGSADGGGE